MGIASVKNFQKREVFALKIFKVKRKNKVNGVTFCGGGWREKQEDILQKQSLVHLYRSLFLKKTFRL